MIDRDSPSVLVRVWLLGAFHAGRRQDETTWKTLEQSALGNSYARSLLNYLLCTRKRKAPRSDIIDALWPERELHLAEKYLNNASSRLYRIFQQEGILTSFGSHGRTGYELAGQEVLWTDIDECEALLREAERLGRTSSQALPLLEQANRHFERGSMLEGESGQWSLASRAEKETVMRCCLLWLGEAYEAQGMLWHVRRQYRTLLETNPLDEDILCRLLAMLHRQGMTHDVRTTYEEAKHRFIEYGLSLSATTNALAEKLLHEPPSLDTYLVPFTTSEITTSDTLVRSQLESIFVPDRTALLWLPDPCHPETYPRFAAWSPLLQESREELATGQELLYVSLEVEIIAMTLQWRQPSDPIVLLQQLTYDVIKKYDAMHKDHSDHNARVTRRNALQAIAMFPIQMYSLTHLVSEMRPIPLDQVLPSCAAGITACWELRRYESDGLLAIQRILLAYLPMLEHVARQSSSYQSAAACLASQGYLLVNVLAEHYGKPDLMEVAARQARFYGQRAQDVNLEVSALIRLAIKFDYEHNDVKALEMYQEAMALPAFSRVSPLLRGRVYAGLAGTHAYCSQTSQALSFLSQAKEVYPNEPEADPTYPFAICDNNTLALWEGLTLKHTDNCADAFSAFTRFGKLTPFPGLLELNRVEHLNYAASVAIRQRDLDATALYLDAAEDVAWQIQDATRLSEVHDSLRSMRLLWPDEAKVKILQEKLSTRQSRQTL